TPPTRRSKARSARLTAGALSPGLRPGAPSPSLPSGGQSSGDDLRTPTVRATNRMLRHGKVRTPRERRPPVRLLNARPRPARSGHAVDLDRSYGGCPGSPQSGGQVGTACLLGTGSGSRLRDVLGPGEYRRRPRRKDSREHLSVDPRARHRSRVPPRLPVVV